MRNPIGVGVVGVGNMGIRYLKCFLQMEEVTLVGVCDLNEKVLADISQRFDGVWTTTNLEALLGKNELDAVFICVSENNHELPLKKAVGSGKHIMIEKPLADSLSSAERMLNLSGGYNKKLSVGHLLRYDPRYSGAYTAIRRGEVGDIVYLTSKRASVISGPRYYKGEASLAFHLAVHDIDLFRWFTSSEIESVSSLRRSQALKALGVDDCLLSLLKFKNGVVAQMEHSWIMPTKYPPKLDARIQIVGTKGIIDLNLRDQGLSIFSEERSEVINTSYFFERADGRITGCLIEQLREFVDAIRSDRDPLVTLRDGYEAVKVADALSRASVKETIEVIQ
ncbi:Gfo/Idh/MocA family oxidoreductase [Mesotoga sp.]|uniref:Gfo/Idh/MocA family protein n=1 Tax=Mesotoga sp. TaxID=2053577 RepID=UPI001BD60D97|nr:Gfo/Idh/MocA family oxidoreductase [Mesotoga sp.]